MGGKGGGDSNYYAQPADTSGYGTPEEAKATLAAQAPLDLSGYQQAIDVQKAAASATAPDTQVNPPSGGGSTISTPLADSVLSPPNYWGTRQDLQPSSPKRSAMQTTQT